MGVLIIVDCTLESSDIDFSKVYKMKTARSTFQNIKLPIK